MQALGTWGMLLCPLSCAFLLSSDLGMSFGKLQLLNFQLFGGGADTAPGIAEDSDWFRD